MNLLQRLSFITGCSNDHLQKILNIDDIDNIKDRDFSYAIDSVVHHLRIKIDIDSIGATFLLVIDGRKIYKGTYCGFKRENNGGGIGDFFVVYRDDDGNRNICHLRKSCYDGVSYWGKNEENIVNVMAYSIKRANEIPSLEESITPDSDGELIYNGDGGVGIKCINGQYFFFDKSGKIGDFYDSVRIDPIGGVIVEKDCLYGLINHMGDVVIPPSLLKIEDFSEGLASFQDCHGWGFLSPSGIVVESKYTKVDSFKNGIAHVCLGKWFDGYINKKGNAIINLNNIVVEFPGYNIICNNDNKIRGIRKESTELEKIYTEPLSSPHLCSQQFDNLYYLGSCYIGIQGTKKILFSKEGNTHNIIDDCELLKEGSRFYSDDKLYKTCYNLFLVYKNSKAGVINDAGTIIVPFEFEKIIKVSDEVILASDGKQMCLFSINGLVRSQSYDECEKSKCVNRFIVHQNCKKGHISFEAGEFKVIFPCVCDDIEEGHEISYIIDNIRDKEKTLGVDGNYIDRPADVLWMTNFSYIGISVALKNRHFGLYDNSFREIKAFEFDSILRIDVFHYLLSRNGVIQLIKFNRKHDEEVIQTLDGYLVSRLSSLVFRVLHKGKYAALKYDADAEKMNYLLDYDFDYISGIDDLFIVTNKGGLAGCFDNNGKEILKHQYIRIISPAQEIYSKESSKFVRNNNLLAYCPNNVSGDVIADIYCYSTNKLQHISYCQFNLKYFDEYSKGCGVYFWVRNLKGEIYLAPLDCSKYEGPFDDIQPFHLKSKLLGIIAQHQGDHKLIDYRTFESIPDIHKDSDIIYVSYNHRFYIYKENAATGAKKVFDSKLKNFINIDDIDTIDSFTDTLYLVSTVQADKTYFGLLDSKFNILLPAIYDRISYGVSEQFIVNKERCYGIVDDRGSFIYPLSNETIILTKDDKSEQCYYAFYNEFNNLASKSSDGLHFIDIVADGERKIFIPKSKSHYYLEQDEEGLSCIKTSFGKVYKDVEEIITEDNITRLKTKNGYYVINTDKALTESPHENILLNKNQKYLLIRDGEHWKFLDFQGNMLGEISGDYLRCLFNVNANNITVISKAQDGHMSYRLFSSKGEILNECSYSYIGGFNENCAVCVINSEHPINKYFYKSIAENEAFFWQNQKNYGKWGIINNNGDIIIPIKFDFISPIKNGVAIYVLNGKYGIINLNNNYRTAPIFKYIRALSKDLYGFREVTNEDTREGCWLNYSLSGMGILDSQGKVIVPATYYMISSYKEGVARVLSNSHFENRLDNEGNLLGEWKERTYAPYQNYDEDEGYSRKDLEDMYLGAYEGDPSAIWNND